MCVLSSIGGRSGSVAVVLLVVCLFGSVAFGQYCSASGGGEQYISGVIVGNLINTGTGSDGYADYTSMSEDIRRGESLDAHIYNGLSILESQCGLWVDWNEDQDFNDVGEAISVSGGPDVFTGTLTPPGRTTSGDKRMRVRIMGTGSVTACGSTTYGEVEDYTIVVVSPWTGSGDADDPYQIWTAENMQAIGADANYWDMYFRLMENIDLSAYTGASFNIIGVGSPYGFKGIFDGNGHTISNFSYDSNNTDNIGIFAYCSPYSPAMIRDLGLINPNVDGGTGNYVGSLVGQINFYSSITGCYVEGGSVSGNDYVGGLVGGNMRGNMTNCSSTASVSGHWHVGGLTGYNDDQSMTNCFSTASVSGDKYVGGLVGTNHGQWGIISSCYSTGTVSGTAEVGGLVGKNQTVTVPAKITDCYSTASVTGLYSLGGLVGTISGGTISNCYSTGYVSGVSPEVGGLVGYKEAGTVTDSFYDMETSGQATSAGGFGLPTAYMQTESTFTDAGWDFVGEVINGPNDIWDICDGTNYPRLAWQIPIAGDFMCPDGVNMFDFVILGDAWFSDPNLGNWDPACDISEPNDNVIDGLDLEIFTDNWLEGID